MPKSNHKKFELGDLVSCRSLAPYKEDKEFYVVGTRVYHWHGKVIEQVRLAHYTVQYDFDLSAQTLQWQETAWIPIREKRLKKIRTLTIEQLLTHSSPQLKKIGLQLHAKNSSN